MASYKILEGGDYDIVKGTMNEMLDDVEKEEVEEEFEEEFEDEIDKVQINRLHEIINNVKEIRKTN